MEAKTINEAFGEPRFGVVLMKDWILDPRSGRSVRSVAGTVEFLEFGDRIAKPGDHSWVLKVSSPTNDAEFVVLLGCQVRGVQIMADASGTLATDVLDLRR